MLVAVVAVVAALALWWPRTNVTQVRAGASLQAAIDGAPTGGVVSLGAGTHAGPVKLTRSIELRGEPDAVVAAPTDAAAAITVTAPSARVTSLRVEGAENGIVVRDANGVTIDDVHVAGSELHGIAIVDASAVISDVVVEDLIHPMAQGIEIRNSDGRPDTIVTGARVIGGQEGIVSHVSEVEIHDSYVAETTLRGITVTEMSDGIVTNNIVEDATGTGFYCGDMSRCAFSGNTATGIGASSLGRSAAGWGLVVTYHSAASSHDNDLGGVAGAVLTSIDGEIRARSPLDPRSSTVLIGPMAVAGGIALLLGAAGYALARTIRRRGPVRPAMMGAIGGIVTLLVAVGVQSFHMVEHWLQVYRVHVDLIPSRGGLVGPSVEAEWVHLTYNSALWLFILLVFLELRRSSSDGRVGLMGGAVLIQGWHSIEHVAKIFQHITTGAKVNPGLLGNFTDLVWFHFTINLTVYGLCLAAALLWFRRLGGFRGILGLATRRPVPA